jgi:hypothetical protein
MRETVGSGEQGARTARRHCPTCGRGQLFEEDVALVGEAESGRDSQGGADRRRRLRRQRHRTREALDSGDQAARLPPR